MNKIMLITVASLIFTLQSQAEEKIRESDIKRGRYLVKTVGCNDCHTPAYGLKYGEVPEKDWLIGDQVGWKGPWGTTYLDMTVVMSK